MLNHKYSPPNRQKIHESHLNFMLVIHVPLFVVVVVVCLYHKIIPELLIRDDLSSQWCSGTPNP